VSADAAVAAADRRPGLAIRVLLGGILLELILLGSGRLVEFGPLTLRMWLFSIALGFTAIVILLGCRVHREVVLLILGFLALTATSATVGLLNRAPPDQIADDVKPLLFFLGLLFFHITIRDQRQVTTIARLIKAGSLILAVSYLGLLALVLLQVIPFSAIYALLSQISEFRFRGEVGIFYKGFLYLGIGLCFFFPERGVSAKAASLLLIVAIGATLTRGLLLSAAAVLVVGSLLQRRSPLRTQVFLLALTATAVAAWPWFLEIFGSRAASDAIRLYDLQVIRESASVGSLFLGHGLGTDVGARARIEASYLEIFHQQGLLGLAFWMVVLLMVARDYLNALRRGGGPAALPFFLGAVYVYLESATNPFLTNPIGMSMVLISLVVLRLLAEDARDTPSPEPSYSGRSP
jgi:hypothetical protein